MKPALVAPMFSVIKSLVLALVLMLGISAWAAPVTEFPFTFRKGLICIQVERQSVGKPLKPLNFLLDSGAEASVIDLKTAQTLRLAMGQPITVRGINATTTGYWPEHLSAKVNGVALPTDYLATDLSAVSSACRHRVDGLIGADFFAGRVVQIDFAKGMIRLLDHCTPAANAEILPLQMEGSRLRVPVEVVGLGHDWARLDTGCASALHWVVSPGATAMEGSSEELGVGVSSILIRENTKTVRLGNLTLNHIPTGLHTEQLLAGEAGLLGAGLLSQFSVVTIDEPGGQLVLEGLSAQKPPTAPKFSLPRR